MASENIKIASNATFTLTNDVFNKASLIIMSFYTTNQFEAKTLIIPKYSPYCTDANLTIRVNNAIPAANIEIQNMNANEVTISKCYAICLNE